MQFNHLPHGTRMANQVRIQARRQTSRMTVTHNGEGKRRHGW